MTIINKLFGPKKKKAARPRCPITREPIEEGFGYLLTTVQIIQSKKYWDMVMTEPETMSYTISHFRNETSGTHMRSLIFEKFSSMENPWMISDSCINLFDVDRSEARDQAQRWWDTEGNFTPDESGPALDHMNINDYNQWKDYAVLEAGRARATA